MTSARKRRREVAGLAAGPAKNWPWVRINHYFSRGGPFIACIEPNYLRELMEPMPDVEGPHLPMLRGEIGHVGDWRFITSPEAS